MLHHNLESVAVVACHAVSELHPGRTWNMEIQGRAPMNTRNWLINGSASNAGAEARMKLTAWMKQARLLEGCMTGPHRSPNGCFARVGARVWASWGLDR